MAHVFPAQPAFNQGYSYDHTQPVTRQPTQNVIFAGERDQPQKPLRNWSTGICGCCEDITSCLLVTFCQECFACYLASKAGETCCLPCCVPAWMISLRAHIRGKHGIQGSICNDCCMVACCYPCAMCQLSREIDNIKNGIAPS